MSTRTIVFVHGMFMTPQCWTGWLARFAQKGYRCHAPAWPGRDRAVPELRAAHPDPALGRLDLTQVVEHQLRFIASLDEKPIVIGHSMGGLVAQILLNRDAVAAAVAIDPAPPAGVFTMKWSFIRSNWPMINPFVSGSTPRAMSFADFQYAFANTLPLELQRKAFDDLVVPESRRVPRESLRAIGRIDFAKSHAPLLITAGERDHIIPPSLNHSNFARYAKNGSMTDFKEFPGRDHFGIGAPGWEEMADFIDDWLARALP